MTDNPYAAPEAKVDAPPASGGNHTIHSPRSVSAGRALEWLAAGFRYFSASPLMWILAILAWFAIVLILSFVPLINIIVSVITPVIVAGFMIGCDAEDRGERFAVNHAFAGFQQTTSQLLVAGGLYLLGSLLLGVIVALLLLLFVGAGALSLAAVGEMGADSLPLLAIALAVLVGLGLSVPLVMAFYFAPPLIALAKLRAVDAMKLSFVGCVRNILPFLVFGVVLFVLNILAVIPLALGYLVLLPVMVAATYAAYKDIFIYQEDVLLGPGQ